MLEGESYSFIGKNTMSMADWSQMARVTFMFFALSTKPIGVDAIAAGDAVALTGSLYLVQVGVPLAPVLHDMPKVAQDFVVVPLLVVAKHTSIGLITR